MKYKQFLILKKVYVENTDSIGAHPVCRGFWTLAINKERDG